jgi:alpha-galactosidase
MLAKKPPMGWNSWNTFGENISDALIRETADAMVETGLRDAGYEYLVIDDCWSLRERDENGSLVADPKKFPNGMKAVADYVHSKGLKFGMYSCCGVKTCAGYPGSWGHEFDDAKFFAEVGIDFLKYDNCYHPSMPSHLSYNRMALALKAQKRDILFSACNWGNAHVETWARACGVDMYRSTGDIFDSFASIRRLSESQKDKLAYSSAGCFNDIDMLVVGMRGKGNVGEDCGYTGCTDGQYRYHFALWCMMMSPLMIGCDIRNMDEETKKLLLNPALIAINQDEDTRPPLFVNENTGHKEALLTFRHLSDGKVAFGFFNTYETKKTFMIPYYEIGLDPLCGWGFDVTDAFTGEHIGVQKEYVSVTVEAGDCRVLTGTLVKVK